MSPMSDEIDLITASKLVTGSISRTGGRIRLVHRAQPAGNVRFSAIVGAENMIGESC
jgi:hypothetical protein